MDAFGGLFCFSSRLPCRWFLFRALVWLGNGPRSDDRGPVFLQDP